MGCGRGAGQEVADQEDARSRGVGSGAGGCGGGLGRAQDPRREVASHRHASPVSSCGKVRARKSEPHTPAQHAEPLTGASPSPSPLHFPACFLGLLPEGRRAIALHRGFRERG